MLFRGPNSARGSQRGWRPIPSRVSSVEPTAIGGGGSGARGPALVYFAKVPRPGRVKTRLCPPLTPSEASALYGAWLDRLLIADPGRATFCYGWPAEELDDLAGRVGAGVRVEPQHGDGLWERMQRCFDGLFERGYGPIVLRNTDSPDLDPRCVDEAVAAAAHRGQIVFGPDQGGGFYLVGLGEPCPGLFWDGPEGRADAPVEGASTSLADMEARARARGLDVVRLAEAADVDTFDDLLALWRRRTSP